MIAVQVKGVENSTLTSASFWDNQLICRLPILTGPYLLFLSLVRLLTKITPSPLSSHMPAAPFDHFRNGFAFLSQILRGRVQPDYPLDKVGGRITHVRLRSGDGIDSFGKWPFGLNGWRGHGEWDRLWL